MTLYFFDTSAIIGVLTSESRFASYRGAPFKTGPANIYELLTLAKAKSLQASASDFPHEVLGIEHEDIEEAADFKLEGEARHPRSKKVPIADALGIAMARRRAMVFVTSDVKHFSEEAEVELVGP